MVVLRRQGVDVLAVVLDSTALRPLSDRLVPRLRGKIREKRPEPFVGSGEAVARFIRRESAILLRPLLVPPVEPRVGTHRTIAEVVMDRLVVPVFPTAEVRKHHRNGPIGAAGGLLKCGGVEPPDALREIRPPGVDARQDRCFCRWRSWQCLLGCEKRIVVPENAGVNEQARARAAKRTNQSNALDNTTATAVPVTKASSTDGAPGTTSDINTSTAHVAERATRPMATWITRASVADQCEGGGRSDLYSLTNGDRTAVSRTRSQIRAGWG